jgi:hypothetical protein
MYRRFPELVTAMRGRLLFWGLQPDQEITILCNTNNYKPIVDATYAAAMSIGARPWLVVVPYKLPFTDIPRSAEAAVSQADFFVDLQHLNWTYTESNARVVNALRAKGAFETTSAGLEEDVDTLLANVPTQSQMLRAKRAQELIDHAREIRVTTPSGTDLTVQRGDPNQYPSFLHSTYAQVAFAQPSGSAEGVIQYVGPLRIQAPYPERFFVRSPMRIEIERGRIARIDRTTGYGAYLDDWFRAFGQCEALDLAHINLGLVPLSTRLIDNEAIHFSYGGFLMGFGRRGTPLFGTPVGNLPNHIDMHHTHGSWYVDGVALLRDGQFTPESGLAFTSVG